MKKINNKIKKRSDTWDDINIPKIEENEMITFRESIPSTNIKKGDTFIIDSYAVNHKDQNIDITFKSRKYKCYKIPYRTFDVV